MKHPDRDVRRVAEGLEFIMVMPSPSRESRNLDRSLETSHLLLSHALPLCPPSSLQPSVVGDLFLVSSQLAPKLDLEENSFTWIELEKLTDIAEGGKGNMYAKMEKVSTCLSTVLWTFGRGSRALGLQVQ